MSGQTLSIEPMSSIQPPDNEITSSNASIYELLLEEDPYLELYSPSSGVYHSFSQLIAYTKQAYEEDWSRCWACK